MTLKYDTYYDHKLKFQDYRRHGEDHRVDGPSSLWHDGDLFWYQYGKLHRIDGPAEVFGNTVAYYQRGRAIDP